MADSTPLAPALDGGSILAETARAWQGRLIAILAGKSDRDRTQRDAVIVFAIRIASAALLYVSQVALARWMGSSDFGIYVVAWTSVLVLGGLSSLGLNQAVIRLIPTYRETGETALLAGLLVDSRRLALAVGTLVAGAGMAGLWLLGPSLAEPYLATAYLAMVCLPIYAVTDVQDGISRGRGWMGLALLPPYLLRPSLVLAGMAFVHLMGWPMSAATAIGAAIVASWVTGLLQFWALGRRLAQDAASVPDRSVDSGRRSPAGSKPSPACRHVRRSDWRGWLGVSLPLMAITGGEMVLQCADVLILSRSMAAADIAVYYAAAKTMSLLLYVHYAVGSATAGRIAALDARGDGLELRRAVSEAVTLTFWPSLAAGVVILAMGQPLLRLFGPDFTAGYPVMLILVLGFLARSAVGPSDVILRMLGQHRLSAAISGVTAVLNVILLLLLIPSFGLPGAAASTACALMVESGLNWYVASRRLGLDIGIWQINAARRV